LRVYNQKHPKTWYENMIYIQHSYNIAIYNSTSKSPFETLFGYFPPLPLEVSYGHQGEVKENITREPLKEEKFVEKIRHIHLQV
jgi:hypothetical protein